MLYNMLSTCTQLHSMHTHTHMPSGHYVCMCITHCECVAVCVHVMVYIYVEDLQLIECFDFIVGLFDGFCYAIVSLVAALS